MGCFIMEPCPKFKMYSNEIKALKRLPRRKCHNTSLELYFDKPFAVFQLQKQIEIPKVF